ncbi:hypothetical protein BUALT_Bualt07G0069400 [Buddleja alternifolia]|uniref:PPC domain-containing protein n=1 Tax=Buddleja alternifolia TaxID=168488 RepID=A0AAV6XJJ6_9LAMI|nr:hypothetical protein BUALT_Bualt07G0069400 [Buddleja alternifolia]
MAGRADRTDRAGRAALGASQLVATGRTDRAEAAGSHSPTHYSKGYYSPPLPPPPPPSNDGATIEVVRRPRGRPPGSKNKPKPKPVLAVITSDQPLSPCMMSPYVLELPPGVDVIESTTRFCRKRNMGLCVLSGKGAVSDFTLKQPTTTTPGATVTFHGRFDILSISATISPAVGNNIGGLFTITVAGPRGQMLGGVVMGPLVSAATVYLIAATVSNPSFHRLDNYTNNEDVEGRDGGGHEACSGGDRAAKSFGRVPIYNSYQPFTPTARQPQPPPPPPPPY